MNKTDISIIVPIFNVERFLPRCVESIINQSFKNFELILINDGSTDSSKEICTEYSKQDNRIKVINQPNRGVSSARNKGILNAIGDYITFVDADDWLHPQYLEILYYGIIKTHSDISACRWTYEDNGIDNYYPDKLSFKTMNAIEAFKSRDIEKGPVCKIIKKSVSTDCLFDERLKFLEDSIYTKTLLLNDKVEKISFVSVPLYFYYQRENSASHTYSASKRIPALIASMEKIGEYDNVEKNLLWAKSTVKWYCDILYIAKKENDIEALSALRNFKPKLLSKLNKINIPIAQKLGLTFLIRHHFNYSFLIKMYKRLSIRS